MRLYAGLSRLFPRSFSAKLLAVTFVGIHLPLLLLIAWLAAQSELDGRPLWSVVIVALLATLAGTALTLSALYRLLPPMRWMRTTPINACPRCPSTAMTNWAACCAASTAACAASTRACAISSGTRCSTRLPKP